MSGKVCEKHQEYAPNGICRWCEPPSSESPIEKRLEAAHVAAENTMEFHGVRVRIDPSLKSHGWYLLGWVPFSNSQIKDNKP